MTKKILMSAGMLIFAGALVVGATGAFFSDTETSTGNTFAAGAIDLKVDSVAHVNSLVCFAGAWHPESLVVWNPETKANELAPGVGAPQVAAAVSAYNIAYPSNVPQAGTECTSTWELADLGAQTFFNFRDIKPGDEGENTISLHVINNPAWACIDVNLTKNDDVSSNEPELAAGDVPEDVGNLLDGELAQNIKFAAWADDGDNLWEQGEPLLFSNQSGPASDVLGGKTYTLADSLGGIPLPGGSTSYIGLAWCAGTQAIVGNTITCDGAGMGNIAQTDMMEASIAFRVEQHRNNPNFRCTPPVVEETATVTVDKVVTFSDLAIDGVDVNDFALTIDGPGAPQGVVDEVATSGLTPGVYTISEVYSGVPANVTFDASFSGGCSEVGNSGVGTMNVVAGVNPTCVITNAVSLLPV